MSLFSVVTLHAPYSQLPMTSYSSTTTSLANPRNYFCFVMFYCRSFVSGAWPRCQLCFLVEAKTFHSSQKWNPYENKKGETSSPGRIDVRATHLPWARDTHERILKLKCLARRTGTKIGRCRRGEEGGGWYRFPSDLCDLRKTTAHHFVTSYSEDKYWV